MVSKRLIDELVGVELCGDGRFELIEKYKKQLINTTNIEDDPDEMKVLNSFMFRVWQMGWLDDAEKQIPKKPNGKNNKTLGHCPICDKVVHKLHSNYCESCGQAIDWSDEDE